MLLRHNRSTNAIGMEKNVSRRYFDYCEILTTEYKWTTYSNRETLIIHGNSRTACIGFGVPLQKIGFFTKSVKTITIRKFVQYLQMLQYWVSPSERNFKFAWHFGHIEVVLLRTSIGQKQIFGELLTLKRQLCILTTLILESVDFLVDFAPCTIPKQRADA